MYCRDCRYELTGITPDEEGEAPCPECGRLFRPLDPTTTARRAEPLGFNSVNPRLALAVLIGAALLLAFARTWLPRPALSASSGWALWEWLGRPYGVERLPPAPNEPDQPEVRVHWWGGSIEAAAATSGPSADPPGLPLWHLSRHGDHWTLDLHRPDLVDPQHVLYWFNSMRSDAELFNIRIESIEGTVQRDPVAAAGDQVDIFTLLARTYGITSMPQARLPGHDVWAWNDESRRLERVGLATWRAQHPDVDLSPAPTLPRVPRHEWGR